MRKWSSEMAIRLSSVKEVQKRVMSSGSVMFRSPRNLTRAASWGEHVYGNQSVGKRSWNMQIVRAVHCRWFSAPHSQ